MINIAGFLAGANDYRTLLSFCLISKRFKEETKSVLFETVFVSEQEIKRCEEGRTRKADVYRFAK